MAATELKPLLSYFYHWESERPEQAFLKQPYGKTWRTLSYAAAGEEARRMASAIKAKGYPDGSNISILSKNCYHWILADIAIQMAGHVSAPLFPNLEKEQLNAVLKQSESRLLFVGKLESWSPEAIPDGVDIIRFPHYEGNARVAVGENWEELTGNYDPMNGKPLADLDSVWTILFTSGTTGTPKGVVLTHRNAAVILANEAQNHDLGIFKLPAHRFFSFLPLNHVAERIAIESACFLVGGTIHFGESLETFAQNLRDVRPTFFFAVPRIWTKFQSAIFQRIPPKRFKRLSNFPVLGPFLKKKIKKALGLDEAGVVLTGAAPTPEHLKAWYADLGIQLREVYGMTETCGAISVTPYGESGSNSVGKAVSSVELKISPDTGELLVKTPWMTNTYFNDPDKTRDMFEDGWLKTGDKGRLDEKGNLFIIGRISDPFKTSKGQFVVPTPLEDILLRSPFLEQVCVVGRGMPQPIALAVLSALGKEKKYVEVHGQLEQALAQINVDLASYERLSTLVLVSKDWSVDNKLLTPTLKVRRNLIDDHYQSFYVLWHGAPANIIREGQG